MSTHNPIGIKRIDHLEFTTQNEKELITLFHNFGFKITQKRQTRDMAQWLMQTGTMKFLVSCSTLTGEYNFQYHQKHGGGASAIVFEVENCQHAIVEAERRGATVVEPYTEVNLDGGVFKRAAINGFGDVRNVFIERTTHLFAPGFEPAEDPDALPEERNPGFLDLDHLTNNVPYSEMDKWVRFYHDIYGFESVRYFEIKGEKTALRSKVVQSDNKQVTIPINEPWEAEGSDQITEFIDRHKGPGVQHIAMSCKDIITTVKKLRANGFEFLTPPPHAYYEMAPERVPGVIEDISTLEKEAILVDGDEKGYLLQIFTKDQIGPSFFEIIERKGHDGFGDGNFQALFDAIERDQMIRGVLK